MDTMLEVRGLGHRYGTGPGTAPSIEDVSFAVGTGEIVCLVGPSGCGKSTLLRLVAGLTAAGRGEVTLHGEPVRGVPPDLAVVFQDYGRSLFGWLTVRGNVEFPLRGGFEKAERRARAAEALAQVGLEGQERKYPAQLSGGMAQRVSIARALAYRPALMLMDEPFASVDAQTRGDLEDLVRDVRARHGITVLLVTHDVDESVYLGDRVVVLSKAPATVATTVEVDLPTERDQIATRESATFVRLRGEVARVLRSN